MLGKIKEIFILFLASLNGILSHRITYLHSNIQLSTINSTANLKLKEFDLENIHKYAFSSVAYLKKRLYVLFIYETLYSDLSLGFLKNVFYFLLVLLNNRLL